jgi:hypothetical protein
MVSFMLEGITNLVNDNSLPIQRQIGYMAKANKGEKFSGWEGPMAHPKHVMCALGSSTFSPFLLT